MGRVGIEPTTLVLQDELQPPRHEVNAPLIPVQPKLLVGLVGKGVYAIEYRVCTHDT